MLFLLVLSFTGICLGFPDTFPDTLAEMATGTFCWTSSSEIHGRGQRSTSLWTRMFRQRSLRFPAVRCVNCVFRNRQTAL